MVRIKEKVAALAAVVVALVASPGCQQNGTRCAAGDYVPCACPTAVKGFAQCLPSGEDYTLCDCSGARPPGVPSLAAAPSTGDTGAGDAATDAPLAKLPFMSPCEKDEQCESGVCFVFNAKGARCSKSCRVDSECPVPSPGCNLQGICKAP